MANADHNMVFTSGAGLVLPLDSGPGEGLLDFLHRVMPLNGFQDLNVLHDLLGIKSRSAWSHFSLAHRQIDPAKISRLMSVGISHVESLTYRKSPRLVEFFGTAISPSYLSNIRRVSPTFLRVHGYQKAIWALRCFSFDPSNMELLLDRCPRCGVALTYRFSAGPCHCSLCGWDLRDSPQETVVAADSSAIDFIRYLIDPTQQTREWDLPESLQRLSRAEIFAIVVTLGSLLEYEKNGGEQDRITTKGTQFDLSAAALMEASAAVLDWSDRFYQTAERVRHVKRHIANKAQHPLVLGIPANMRSLKKFLKQEIRKDSGSSRHQLQHLSSGTNGTSAVRYQFPKSVEADVSSLGLPRAEVLALYRMGSVSCPDRKLREILVPTESGAPFGVLDFLRQVPGGCSGPALKDIVITSKPARHPWAAVFKAVFRGHVIVSRVKSGGCASRFHTTEMLKVREICMTEETQIDGKTEIGWLDASLYLNIGPVTIALLKSAGLLPGRKLRLGDVWRFQENFMTTSEIHSHLRLTGQRSSNWELWSRIESLGLIRAVPGVGVLNRADGEIFLGSYRSEGPLGPVGSSSA
ncbi:hypothetical protein [Rhizobium sp. R693]|uniref:hypothetical protein n=1 Tax=Rhizobium sp. R693 TaxID=1764276 RepID=UPI0011328FEF|nr:hypothetical protein [Rhizobium sp. R693]